MLSILFVKKCICLRPSKKKKIKKRKRLIKSELHEDLFWEKVLLIS